MSDRAISLFVPEQKFLLEEANLPANVIACVAGQSVRVQTYPEEPPGMRRVESDDFPLLIDPEGNYWNDYRPVRVLYTDPQGQQWRFPRRWLPTLQPIAEDFTGTVWQEASFSENLHLPSEWDLWEINIPWNECHRAGGTTAKVEVSIHPGEPSTVSWRDSSGNRWRIPHDWRRRLIKLGARPTFPAFETAVVPPLSRLVLGATGWVRCGSALESSTV